jgi:hypothetical protein
MALNLNESIIEHKIDIPLDPAYLGPLESGMIMVDSGTGAGGQQLCAPCTGAAGEVVLGALKLSENSQESVPTLEDLTVPAQLLPPAAPLATFSLTLRELPTAVAAMRATVIADPSGTLAAGAVITVVAGAPGAGQIGVNLATGVLTIDAALAEVSFRIVYRFAISAQELARRGGRRSVNMGAERIFNQVTIMRGDCKLLISNFNTGAAIAPSTNLTCGAGGSVTVGGAGTVVGFCFQAPVLKLTPGIEQAFIGLEANLGG